MDELLVEYYEDLFAKNPNEIYRAEDGEFVLESDNDEMFNTWEQQLANGETPDLWSAFSPEAKKNIEERLTRAKQRKSGR